MTTERSISNHPLAARRAPELSSALAIISAFALVWTLITVAFAVNAEDVWEALG